MEQNEIAGSDKKITRDEIQRESIMLTLKFGKLLLDGAIYADLTAQDTDQPCAPKSSKSELRSIIKQHLLEFHSEMKNTSPEAVVHFVKENPEFVFILAVLEFISAHEAIKLPQTILDLLTIWGAPEKKKN